MMSSTRSWKRVGEKGAIKIGPEIGQGNQSKLYKGVFEQKPVAVKSIFYDFSTKEVEILRNLDHPNILKIFFTDISEKTLYIVLELCQHTLTEYVESSGSASPNLTYIQVLEQMTEGLFYLHNGQKFCTVHRDLKPSNILFQYVEREKIWRVKISDFGISKEFYGGKTSTMTRLRGTSGYTAPELLTLNQDVGRIRKETDMFSLGVIYYYTLSGGKHPFSDDPNDVNAKVRDCEPCLDGLHSDYVGQVESLILAMLEKNYEQRISVREVKCHYFFWEADKKLDFLTKASNYMEDRKKHQTLIDEFELCLDDITCCELWRDVICRGKPELKRVIEKRSGWEKRTSTQDLLRQIRNWSGHFFDKNTTSELQEELGGTSEFPSGFMNFFTSRFPKLLLHSYDIMKSCKDEDNFKSFYEVKMESTVHLHVEEQPESSLCATQDAVKMDVDIHDEDDILPSSDEEDMDTSESATSRTLVLRNYQKELAGQALAGENSLIIAPTGSGKTAVANEIIKNHLISGKSKSIIFLVSKTTLARQQYDFFSRNLEEHLSEMDIAYLIGEITINTAVGAIIKTMKLIILTPQILIDELKRLKSFISFANISMMIFDECHNATKSHPYKVLMDMMLDYKADHPQEDLIQVVGMTASPGVGKGKTRDKVLENLITLLASLDVKVCPAVVEKHIAELHQFQNKIKEIYIRVKITEDRFSRKIRDAMILIEKKLTDLGVFGNYGIRLPPDNKEAQLYENWVVDLINHVKVNEERSDVSRVSITYAFHLKMYHTLLYFKKHIPNAMEYTNTLAEFEQDGEVGRYLRTINSRLERYSVDAEVPMLEKLFNILGEEFKKKEDSRCIIFVPRKLIAPALAKCIKDNDELKHLEPEYVTGTSEHDLGGMTKTKQESNIRAFRDGKCRILIATSVAEEGLDIHACNLVIMYNYVTGEVGRIQRAGRGRADNSRSILITPQDSEQIQKEKINAACAIATDQALKDLKDLSHDKRIEKIQYIQRSQRRERLQIVQQNAHQLQETSNWKILCGQCKAYITKPDQLRQIKNQHKFVVDPDFLRRVQKAHCTPRAIAPGVPFTQTAIFKCKDTKCKYIFGIEMQYKEKKYPTLRLKQLVFEDPTGEIKDFKKWSKCPFSIVDIDVDEEEEQIDPAKIREFALSQRDSISKGFNPDDISQDDALEAVLIANSN